MLIKVVRKHRNADNWCSTAKFWDGESTHREAVSFWHTEKNKLVYDP